MDECKPLLSGAITIASAGAGDDAKTATTAKARAANNDNNNDNGDVIKANAGPRVNLQGRPTILRSDADGIFVAANYEDKVGRCRLTVSNPVLKVPML